MATVVDISDLRLNVIQEQNDLMVDVILYWLFSRFGIGLVIEKRTTLQIN